LPVVWLKSPLFSFQIGIFTPYHFTKTIFFKTGQFRGDLPEHLTTARKITTRKAYFCHLNSVVMALVQQNFAAYLRTLRIIFAALVMGQVLALGVFYFVRWQEMPALALDWETGIRPFLSVALLAFAAIGFFLNHKNLANARAQPDLKGKLRAYRLALLLRWAPLEAVVLIIGVLYFLTSQMSLLYLAGSLVVVFMAQWPNRTQITNALELSAAEQLMLDDPNAMVSEISQRP